MQNYLKMVLKSEKSQNIKNTISNSVSLYHKTNFKYALLFFKHLVRSMQMLLNPNPDYYL